MHEPLCAVGAYMISVTNGCWNIVVVSTNFNTGGKATTMAELNPQNPNLYFLTVSGCVFHGMGSLLVTGSPPPKSPLL